MRQIFIFLILFSPILVFAPRSVSAHSTNSLHDEQVILSDRGFEPESLTVSPGTTVTFKIKGDNQHWPASNFHPSHDLYPDSGGCIGSKLDSCKGLKSGETYSFKFNQKGAWSMHDHLFPGYTMVVRVTGESSEKQSVLQLLLSPVNEKIQRFFGMINAKLSIKKMEIPKVQSTQKGSEIVETCKILPKGSSKRYTCYARAMEEVAFRFGNSYAQKVLYALGEKDTSAKSCHFISHGIGWGTYRANPENWRKSLNDSSSACAYGEQMGILEYYIKDLPNGELRKEEVADICGPAPRGTCNHMVGHMLLILSKNDIAEAAEMCSVLSKRQQYHCFTGLNMEVIMSPNLVEHGLLPASYANWVPRISENEKKCRSYEGVQAITCWKVLGIGAYEYYNKDARKVFDFCDTAQDKSAAFECKMYSMSGFTGFYDYNLSELEKTCSMDASADSDFIKECNKLIVASKINFLSTDKSVDAVPFCSGLISAYQEECFAVIGLSLRKNRLSEEKRADFCKNAPNEYKEQCIGVNVPTSML